MFGPCLSVFVLLIGLPLANVIAPFVWLWPGIIAISGPVAIPATVLAAFLEWPFVSRSGVQQRTLRYSLLANFLSLLVGIVLVPGAYTLMWTLGLFFFVSAVALSIIVEGLYLRRVARDAGRSLRWRWIIAGNLVSSVVLMSISAGASTAAPMVPYRIQQTLWTLMVPLTIAGILMGVVALAVALWPVKKPPRVAAEAEPAPETVEPSCP